MIAPIRQKENDVNSEKQQDKNRELTDLELDAVNGGGYVYNPASGVPKTLGEPAVNRGEQIASFSALALVAPETGKIARCSQAPKRPPPSLLPALTPAAN
jgi:hypothetical protein